MRAVELPLALWLRDPDELAKPPSPFAILWPAYEYTVLVFGKNTTNGNGQLELDPFERAIYSASASNVVGIAEQAEIFDLNPHFVAHLHQRLMERGVFDDYSRPKSKAIALQDAEVLLAVRIYQDPWTATLWPRFVVDASRRTVPAGEEHGRYRLLMGTTGSPAEVRALHLHQHLPPATPPSSDDAVRAIEQWSRLKRSHKLPGRDLLKDQHPSARVLPDSVEAVLLCCPANAETAVAPRVHDPFGGPEWSPFTRALVQRAQSEPPLHAWLFEPQPDDRDEPQPTPTAPGPPNPSTLREHLYPLLSEARDPHGVPRHARQLRLDLEAIGQLALDILWQTAPRTTLQLATDPDIDGALLGAVARTAGFDPSDPVVPADLGSLVERAPGPLRDRCVALLLLYPADQPGPLHKLAERVPRLFALLRGADRHDLVVRLIDLADVTEALVAVALEWTETPTDIGTEHGQEQEEAEATTAPANSAETAS